MGTANFALSVFEISLHLATHFIGNLVEFCHDMKKSLKIDFIKAQLAQRKSYFD